MAAPSAAAVTATIALDKSYYTNTAGAAGAKAKVTVVDADANVAKPQRESAVTVNTLANGVFTANVVLTNKNIVGTPTAVIAGAVTDSAGALVTATNAITNLEIQVVSAQLGVIKILSGATADYGNIDVLYKTSEVEKVKVTVYSDQDPTGLVDLELTETGVDTGKFEATVTLSTLATSSTAFQLKALHGQTVTAKHKDTTPASGTSLTVSATATIETGKPTYTGLLPAHKFSTQANQPVISGTVNDAGGSGLDVSTIVLLVDRDKSGTFDTGESFAPTVTGSDGDATVTFTFTPAVLVEGDYTWQVESSDLAGNTAKSDSVTDVTDTASTIGDNKHEMSVDISAPVIDYVETGRYWDADTKTEKSSGLAKLVAVFKEDLEASTVAPEDFTVEGLTPLTAELSNSSALNKVYMTLAANLAASDAPVVALAAGSAISDKAGNALNVLSKAAVDKISPTFTVALDATLTKAGVVVSVSADEKISGIPTVTAYHENGSDSVALTVVVKTSTSWEATFAKVTGKDGKWSVEVVGNDLKNNATTEGNKAKWVAAAGSVYVFTQDTTAPTVAFTSSATTLSTTAVNLYSSSPFITVTFNEKNVTVDSATFDVSTATDAPDVTASGKLSSDGNQWVYKATDLVEDSTYTILVNATDLAGNSVTKKSAKFTVKAPAKLSIALSPGQNLVSLPSAPTSTAINDVIDVADVISVITYDPINPDPDTGSPWLSATRDADGVLSGSLTTIDDTHAYWVETTSFAPLKVEVPAQSFAAVPPSIPVVAGWNMVPVVDIQGAAVGTQIGAAQYLRSVDWESAYSYDTVADKWVGIANPGKFDFVKVGLGYWLYVNEADTLVP